jgi:hypothetical protein
MGPTELDLIIIFYDHDPLKSLKRLFVRIVTFRDKNWSGNSKGQTPTPFIEKDKPCHPTIPSKIV